METRIQRVVVETERFRLTGDVSLPTEGFRTRLSDVLNRADTEFIALVNVELTPVGGGEPRKLPFLAVSRSSIELAYESDDED